VIGLVGVDVAIGGVAGVVQPLAPPAYEDAYAGSARAAERLEGVVVGWALVVEAGLGRVQDRVEDGRCEARQEDKGLGQAVGV